MDVAAIRARIKEIIADVSNIEAKDIGDDVSFKEDLGLDSLSLLEIGVTLDYEFKLDVPDEVLQSLTTVQDAVELVQGRGDVHATELEVS